MLGGAVQGGEVHGQWPGLQSSQLYQNRDLRPTTDLRQIAKAVLTQHLKLPAEDVEARVFPGSANFQALDGLIKA
jgi:uncharacterized protein (DUF1501 family)